MTHETNNIGDRAEHPGSDEQKISAMLTGLKRVEAPKDFDFHLRARIANARPSSHQRSSLLPILKYAVPLGLFLVVGAIVLAVSSYNSWEAPTVIVQAPEAVPATQPTAAVSVPDVSTPAAVAGAEPKEAPREPAVERPRLAAAETKPALNKRDGRSVDFMTSTDDPISSNSAEKAIKIAPTPITPRGILKPMTIDAALDVIGVEADFAGGLWNVKAVKSNGIADQIGVKPGDKLKAIEGRQLGEKTEFESALNVSTIQVVRDGKTIDLTVRKQ
ncbi:MAG: hypothetical protein IT174_15905 [Acidobacteria bacterium]|nr:hypothetical protein [Acidobacteriota bacterium]